jgi:hypothetical protein
MVEWFLLGCAGKSRAWVGKMGLTLMCKYCVFLCNWKESRIDAEGKKLVRALRAEKFWLP